MKTAAIASPLIVSDSLEGSVMGMDAQGMDLATYFMRDKIYSNKILAVVREYICNAIDEHKKFNISQPIEAGLRYVGNDVHFYVRDFAKGLSEEHVRSIFGMYFRSTKSQSNEGIGGFGVGSKAAHCYTDTFNVTSYHNNSKSVYVCTLGGGSNGVPVGHIFKIDDSVDNQTGVKIEVAIKEEDKNHFESYLRRFCNYSLHPIKLNIFGTEYNTPKPVKQFVKDNILFRLFEGREYAVNQIMLQMGGVLYDSLNNIRNHVSVKSNHVLVVDVPIGAMSIPISRERFEDNPANRRYKDKVIKHIEDLIDSDMQIFKDKKITTLVNESLDNGGLSDYLLRNEWFQFNKAALYPDFYKFLCHIWQINKAIPAQKRGGKTVVVVIPDNSASDYWKNKLADHCTKNNINYVCISEAAMPKDAQHFENDYVFVSVKRLKFEKQSKNIATIYLGTCTKGRKDALETHNMMRAYYNLPTASSLQEAAKQNEEYLQNCDSLHKLNQMTLAINRQFRSDRFFIASQSLKNDLEKINIYCETHDKIRNLKKDLEEKQKIKNDIRKAQNIWINFNNKTSLLIKNHKNALRILGAYNQIKEKNLIIKKTFTCFENVGSWNRPTFTREEVRMMLRSKA